ncbi:endopeptidase La, partial [Sphingobacteriaceae bacterium AH-315-L07]|nr:endopeptidase La [Sphingobacteriaceae bacterium AH-315-L07]
NDDDYNHEEIPTTLSILPLRNTVLFPDVVIPITVGRDKSIDLIKHANKKDKIIGVVAQKDSNVEEPTVDDLNKVGTVARILKMLKLPDGNTTIIIQGRQRFKIKDVVQEDPYIKAKIEPIKETSPPKDQKFDALVSSLKEMANKIIKLSPNIPSEAGIALKNIESTSFLINFISSNMNAEVKEKQKMLEVADLKDRANLLLKHLTKELHMLELKNQIQDKVRGDLDEQQREFFLHQQLKTIQEELGVDNFDKEIDDLRAKGKKKKWGKEVEETFTKELDKLSRMNPAAAEYSVVLNYLELLLDLPWHEFTTDNFDLNRAKKVLDKDHYGLDNVKERILEYLAVLKLKADMKAPILCLYGPPGVGKTSLGRSIANALNRKYVRMSLGGIRDEAEVRGHRKTYIGAMPGRIMQSLKKAKSSNPVFVLDEIDKVGSDFRGDPSSALLEVLDPEQNKAFYDNYIELDFDLSNVMFIATANNLSSIQPALLDRMEIIEINGYTIEEKVQIAKKHLIPKQLKEHGIKAKNFKLTAKRTEKVVDGYTGESGVRNLEKQVAKLIRGTAKKIALEEKYNPNISEKDIINILGAEAYDKETFIDNDIAGVVTGLAWTSIGGDILFVEVSLSRGKGKLTLTGSLGDVMKESATTALSYLKAHCKELKIDSKVFNNWDIHIHVPAGATPKDGPSAGITILTALTSAFTQKVVKPKLAMTGEITLRGKVLPVGGIKEKILAAKRGGIKEILLSRKNKKDIDEIKKDYISDLKFHYVDHMMEVLSKALLSEKVSNPLDLTVKEVAKTE